MKNIMLLVSLITVTGTFFHSNQKSKISVTEALTPFQSVCVPQQIKLGANLKLAKKICKTIRVSKQ